VQIARVKVKPPHEGAAQRIWPPAGASPVHPGSWTVTVVVLGGAAVEVVDSAGKTVGEGISIATTKERTFGPMGADELFAAVASGEVEVAVIACDAP
jgi:hypothetical protein